MLPCFPVSLTGSWPRSPGLVMAKDLVRQGRLEMAAFHRIAEDEIRRCVSLQEKAGADLVSDGELRRGGRAAFLASWLQGVQLQPDDGCGDGMVPAPCHPVCTGPLFRRNERVPEDAHFLKSLTGLPVKVILPGPYSLTCDLWDPRHSAPAYASRMELGLDLVALLCREIADLCSLGVHMIQLDEARLPWLAASGATSLDLGADTDAGREMDFAVDLINRVTDLIHELSPARSALHIPHLGPDAARPMSCRIMEPIYSRIRVSQLVLGRHATTPNDLSSLGSKELGLGVVDPDAGQVESVESIVERVGRVLETLPPDKLFLNPLHGFAADEGTGGCAAELAFAKIRAMSRAARQLRSTAAC